MPARVRAARLRCLRTSTAAPSPGCSGAPRSASVAPLPAPAATRTRLPSPSLGDSCCQHAPRHRTLAASPTALVRRAAACQAGVREAVRRARRARHSNVAALLLEAPP